MECAQERPRKLRKVVSVLKLTRGDWLKRRHRLNDQPSRGVEGQVLEENDQKADIQAPGDIELARIRSDRKRRQKSEERGQLTVEEEEDLIRVQLEEIQESPAVKEQIARVLRESYRERFGTYPEPASSSKRPSRSHKDPVDELDDLPSSELDELEEKYGQSIEVTSEGQARLKGTERQEKERLEKAKPATEMVGKVSREEYERQRAVTKKIERERRKEYEKE